MKNLVRVCQGQQYLANVICKKKQLYTYSLDVYIQRKRRAYIYSADTNKRTQASEVYRTG